MEQNKINELYAVAKEYTEEVYRINAQLDSLESKKLKALADFDISYAAKLALEIDSLKAARDKKMEDVLKYNNEISAKEAQYEADKKLSEQKILGNEYDLLKKVNDPDFVKEIENKRNAEIFDYLYSYLATLSKDDAMYEFLTNPDIRASLSATNFNRLYEIINRR